MLLKLQENLKIFLLIFSSTNVMLIQFSAFYGFLNTSILCSGLTKFDQMENLIQTKIETICHSKTRINVFIYIEPVGLCESYSNDQYFFFKNLKKDKKLSNLTFLFQYYNQKNIKWVKFFPSFSNSIDFNNLCKKQKGIDSNYTNIFLSAPTNLPLNIFFYAQDYEITDALPTLLKRSVFPIVIALQDASYNYAKKYIGETSTTFVHYSLDHEENYENFKKMLCTFKTRCKSPKKYIGNNAILNKNVSEIYYLGQSVNYKCLNKIEQFNQSLNITKLTKNDNKNKLFQSVCSFYGLWQILEKTNTCQNIVCSNPKINSKNIKVSYIKNLRGEQYSQNQYNKTLNITKNMTYMSLIEIKCKKHGFQINYLNKSKIKLICLESGKQETIENNIIWNDFYFDCQYSPCDSIKSLKNAKIIERNKTAIQGICNPNFENNSKKNIFYICDENGINLLLECKKKSKKIKFPLIGIMVFAILMCLSAFVTALVIFILEKHKRTKNYIDLEKNETF